MADAGPVKAIEEGVRFDFLCPVPAESYVSVVDQLHEQVGSVGT